MKRIKALLPLFLQFMKFGCFTFGGGWSIVAQMQKLYVNSKKVLTNEELLDLTSVARSLPGVMIGNVAMLFGYRTAGIPGGIVCVFGMAIPPMAVLSVITIFYTAFENNQWVMAAMSGIRCAVVPIIASAMFGMFKGSFRVPPCIFVAAAAFSLYFFLDLNCVWIVIFGGVCGLAISEYYERRDKKGHGAD